LLGFIPALKREAFSLILRKRTKMKNGRSTHRRYHLTPSASSDSSETSPLPQSELDQVRRDASTIANPEPEILEFAHFGLGSTTPRYCRGTSAR